MSISDFHSKGSQEFLAYNIEHTKVKSFTGILYN